MVRIKDVYSVSVWLQVNVRMTRASQVVQRFWSSPDALCEHTTGALLQYRISNLRYESEVSNAAPTLNFHVKTRSGTPTQLPPRQAAVLVA